MRRGFSSDYLHYNTRYFAERVGDAALQVLSDLTYNRPCWDNTSLSGNPKTGPRWLKPARSETLTARLKPCPDVATQTQGNTAMTSKIIRRYGVGDGALTGSAHGHAAAEGGAVAAIQGQELQPNRGIPLNLDWVEEVRVNTSAVERRAQTLVTRRTVKKEWQIAWLLRAIS